jgi:Propanediol dehydratase, large subunit
LRCERAPSRPSPPCSRSFDLGQPTEDMKSSVVAASGSDETRSYLPRDVVLISESIKERAITVVDVIKALARRGFMEEAENLLSC